MYARRCAGTHVPSGIYVLFLPAPPTLQQAGLDAAAGYCYPRKRRHWV